MEHQESYFWVGLAIAANLIIVGASIAVRRIWGRGATARSATFALGVQVARLLLTGAGLALAVWLSPAYAPALREALVLSWTGSYLCLVLADGLIEICGPRAPRAAHAL